MLRLRENIELNKSGFLDSLSYFGIDESIKENSEEFFNIGEEIRLLIEIQDILDELDILEMVRNGFVCPFFEIIPKSSRHD